LIIVHARLSIKYISTSPSPTSITAFVFIARLIGFRPSARRSGLSQGVEDTQTRPAQNHIGPDPAIEADIPAPFRTRANIAPCVASSKGGNPNELPVTRSQLGTALETQLAHLESALGLLAHRRNIT
jgi:hypothetical protein